MLTRKTKVNSINCTARGKVPVGSAVGTISSARGPGACSRTAGPYEEDQDFPLDVEPSRS